MKAIVHKHFTKLQAITSGDENDTKWRRDFHYLKNIYQQREPPRGTMSLNLTSDYNWTCQLQNLELQCV